MAIEITVPRLGWTMEEGVFLGWIKRDGDVVREGEPLFTLEGDKAAQDVPATDTGILRIPAGSPNAGDTVRVGSLLGHLVAPGEEGVAGPRSAKSPPTSQRVADVMEPSVAAEALEAGGTVPAVPAGAARISPRAARAALALGVDWRELRGTGSSGRIRERDVIEASAVSKRGDRRDGTGIVPPGLSGHRMAVGNLRQTIARRMSAGVREAAPVTLAMRADATRLVRLRASWKSMATPAEPAPTLNDLLLKIVAAALARHPALNSLWLGDALFVPDRIHLAMAIDTDQGLVAPVIRDVGSLGLREVAAAARALAELARGGRLGREQLEGGTFTVTNLGALGVETFNPILNLPQCGILGIGRIGREPVVSPEGIVARDVVPLNLTFDHRAVDGAPAARFLGSVRELVENPPEDLAP